MNRFFNRLFSSIPRAFRSQRWRRSKFVRFTIGIVLTLVLAVLFPQVQSPQNVTGYSVGALWTSSDVVAPFNFRLFKEPHKYRTEVTKALENYYPVFVVDTSAKRRTISSLTTTLFAFTDNDNNESLRKVLADAELSSEEIAQLATYAGEQRSLTAKSEEAPFERITSVIEKLYDSRYLYHSIPAEYNSPGRTIAIRKRSNEEVLDTVGHLVSFEEAKNILAEQLDKKIHQRASAVTKVIAQLLVPNIAYDKDASDESRKTIAARVPKPKV
jgi:membrane-associated HD superfamily phosphohydrolase